MGQEAGGSTGGHQHLFIYLLLNEAVVTIFRPEDGVLNSLLALALTPLSQVVVRGTAVVPLPCHICIYKQTFVCQKK